MTKKRLFILFALIAIYISIKGQNTDYYTEGENYSPDMGFQSDYHKSNVGKIAFLKTWPDPKDNNPKTFSSFQAGEEIFFIAYMQTCVMNYKTYEEGKKKKEYKNKSGTIRVDVYIDDVRQKYSLRNTAFVGDLAPRTYIRTTVYSTTKEFGKDNYTYFVESLEALSTGEHKIRFEIFGTYLDGNTFCWTKTPIATGELTYVKSASTKIKTGKSFAGIKAEMVDPDLEAEALKTLKEYKPTAGARPFVRPKLTSDKIKIISKDWKMTRHPNTGVITHRHIYVVVECKDPETNKCYAQVYCLFQNYTGGDFQKTFTEASITSSGEFLGASPYYVDCE